MWRAAGFGYVVLLADRSGFAPVPNLRRPKVALLRRRATVVMRTGSGLPDGAYVWCLF